MEPLNPEPEATPPPPSPADLAAAISAKLCHDMISPTGAINSGVDLLQDPDSGMREDALELIADSAKKLGALLEFYRVAFGASAAAESFDVRALKSLVERIFEYQRAELSWDVAFETLPKPAARALLNVAQIAGAALPRGGQAMVRGREEDGTIVLETLSEGRIMVKSEVTTGLSGRPLGEGMVGYWVQGYYLSSFVADAGGSLTFDISHERLAVNVRLPL